MTTIAPTTTKRNIVPLIIEPHPKTYNGLPFLTLVLYRKVPMLTIIDNMNNENIRAFVLDLCDPEGIDKEALINIASVWYENDRDSFPISIAFSRAGITPQTSKIYRVIAIELVSRVIGPCFSFPMTEVTSVRRRKRKIISAGIEIVEAEELTQ